MQQLAGLSMHLKAPDADTIDQEGQHALVIPDRWRLRRSRYSTHQPSSHVGLHSALKAAATLVSPTAISACDLSRAILQQHSALFWNLTVLADKTDDVRTGRNPCAVQLEEHRRAFGRSPLGALAPVLVLHLIQLHPPDPPVRVPVLHTQIYITEDADTQRVHKPAEHRNLEHRRGAMKTHGATNPISPILVSIAAFLVHRP